VVKRRFWANASKKTSLSTMRRFRTIANGKVLARKSLEWNPSYLRREDLDALTDIHSVAVGSYSVFRPNT